MFSGYQNIQCRHDCSWLCFYLMSVGLQHIRRRGEFDMTECFSSFYSTYRKRLRLVRVICGGNCKKLILHRGIVSSLFKHNITIIIIFNVILCVYIRKTRVQESLESVKELVTMNRLRWRWRRARRESNREQRRRRRRRQWEHFSIQRESRRV